MFRLGPWLVALIALSAPLVSCGAAAERALSAINGSAFAQGFIVQQLQEEGALQATCQALRAQPTDHDKSLLCRALFCGEGAACPCGVGADLLKALREQPGARASADVLAMVGASLGIKLDARLQDGEAILGELRKGERAYQKTISQINLAKAGLFVVLRLSDQAQGAAEYIASSIPYVGGLARPLLERAAAALVAAALDEVLTLVEDKYGLPRKDFSKEACALFDRSEMRSEVANSVLRRTILRYAGKEQQAMAGALTDCAALASARAREGAPSVCVEMAEKVLGPAAKAAAASTTRAKGVEDLLRIEPPKAERLDPRPLQEQARWLSVSAKKCLEDASSGSKDTCTLERVLPVAGYLYGITMDPKGALSVADVRFSEIERSLKAIEADLSGIHRDLEALDGRLAACEARWSSGVSQAFEAASSKFDERMRGYMMAGGDKDRKIAALSAELKARDESLARIGDACKKPYSEALDARRRLSAALGLDASCAGAAAGARRASTKYPALSVDQASLCDVDRPVLLYAQHRFSDCETTIQCSGDATFCAMAEALGKAVGPIASEGDDRRKPLFVQGHASRHHIKGGACWKKAEEKFDALFRSRGLTNAQDKPEPFNIALSHLRAEDAARLLAKWLGGAGSDFNAYSSLDHAGSYYAERDCSLAGSEEEKRRCHEGWQRVDVTIRLDKSPFVFHEPDCLARLSGLPEGPPPRR